MNNFRIRCSQIGKIMKDPRSSKDLLSKTAQSYVQEWIHEQVYGIGKEIDSKYLTKGIEVEDEAIEVIKDWLFLDGSLIKNEDYYEDDWITGTPDLIDHDNGIIYDAKSSWDHMTFPLLYTNIPNKDYWWQMQGYMHLTGYKEAHVCYVLCNTPEHIGTSPMDYNSLPLHLRIKTFQVDYDEIAVASIKTRVEECREYINTYYSKYFE